MVLKFKIKAWDVVPTLVMMEYKFCPPDESEKEVFIV